jgi:molybdenum cofactor cytidylyltransferase
MIATLVLAAGRSSRFGSDKLRASVAGRTVLEWTLDFVLRAVPPQTCHVVTSSATAADVAVTGVTLTVVPEAARGLGHSLHGALLSLPAGYHGVVVIPADDPLAALALPRVHAAAMRAPDAPIAVRRTPADPYPIHLPRWLWPGRPAGDADLGMLLDSDTIWVEPAGLPAPVDVDTPADLARLEEFLGAEALV